MAFKTLAAALASAITLTACTTPTQPFLDQAKLGCAQGNQQDCSRVPHLQSMVTHEQNAQAEKVAAGILLGIAAVGAGAAAGYAASQPTYYYAPVTPVVLLCGRRYC